ncbi:hypothetical protein GCM10027051_31090 [Niabella terrae]
MQELKEKLQDKPEMAKVAPVKKEKNHLGSLRFRKGQKVYAFDISTGMVEEAEYESTACFTVAGHAVERKIITKSTCIYTTALNMKNAVRKFRNLIGQR